MRIDLTYQLPKEEWKNLLGLKLDERSYDKLIDHDADVYTPEGELLCRFRKGIIPAKAVESAWAILRTIRTKSLNRALATQKLVGSRPIRKSGVRSKTYEVPSDMAVTSNIIGFYDRYVRTPFCRQTAWTAKHPELWKRLNPFLYFCTEAYRQMDPEKFEVQKAFCESCKPEWIIPNTAFTTVTVNKNWQTAVHMDKGDLKTALSSIVAMRAGEFTGGHLVFPHYRVAFDLRNGDYLLFDSHHMHGNTPMVGRPGRWERVSCVLYCREKMVKCGTAAEELEIAKRRKRGEELYE